MTRFLSKFLSLSCFVAVISNTITASVAAAVGDGVVEIEKQKLVKFPDDAAEQNQERHETPSSKEKHDEAQRILEQIEKINQSLGYVKKQPEQPKLPPILDSSQYLFPKPAYQPFHAQSHQISGSNGEILLVPSIRAMKFDRSYNQKLNAINTKLISNNNNYNIPPQRRKAALSTTIATSSSSSTSSPPPHQQQKISTKTTNFKPQYYFRPNQVHVPAPQNEKEQQQLPTHFVIPVRLYKLNKEEYLKKFAPQEYRVKGYKIVGDIDNFYGKAKPTNNKQKVGVSNKKKSTPKYHLFFLPRELALNADSTFKYGDDAAETVATNDTTQDTGSREEKLANRPFKVQTSSSTGNNGTSSSTQIVRKRVIPKPLRNKETNINTLATQQLSDGSTATSATTIHITPPPPQSPSATGTGSATSIPNSGNINTGIVNVPPNSVNTNKNSFGLLGNRPSLSSFLTNNNNNNRPNSNQNDGINNNQALANDAINNVTTANAIKLAFQNFFKLPFRPQDPKPSNVAETAPTNLESVPLQIPQKTFFAAQPFLPQPFYQSEVTQISSPNQYTQHQQHISSSSSSLNQQQETDYKWDDESSNSAAEDENISPEEAEKKIFGHHHHQQQETQKEAIKQGGIIIQRLKVRKGGIAIAGPGGVATAGSGGTAIVGPGGYALTHPRSLTIAGPGAKVIAIPADVDLKDALQRTNLDSKSFPREGKVVATGPTVYYSPATGTVVDE